MSIVYGTRTQNSSTIQLYEIQSGNNENIVLKSSYLEDTRRGHLLPRFLEPHFAPLGKYAFIIRFASSNSGKPGQKANPYIARIHFDQAVSYNSIFRGRKESIGWVFSIHKSMRNRRRISTLMKFFMSMIPIRSISLVRKKIIPSKDKSTGRGEINAVLLIVIFDC